jgi:hypothetical protein
MGRGTLAGGRGVGRVPIPTRARGHTAVLFTLCTIHFKEASRTFIFLVSLTRRAKNIKTIYAYACILYRQAFEKIFIW